MLTIAGIFLLLHAVHLKADFPNNSPWVDWAKYTDEGWYGDAAIRFYLRGAWHLPGDFNPAVALPVWPLLEAALFGLTGVSIVAARGLAVAVFAGILIVTYLLMRRLDSYVSSPEKVERSKISAVGRMAVAETPLSLAPAIAVLLLAVNPFIYVFTRMAILEPMLILLTLLALLVAARFDPQETGWRARVEILLLGVVLALMIGTKTTALFLLPSVAWMLWTAAGHRWKPFVREAAMAAGVAGAIWAAYFLFFVRPHYLADFRYLFLANQYTQITRDTFFQVIEDTFNDGVWIGPVLYSLSMLAIAVALVRWKMMRDPLLASLMLWTVGYLAFLAYHANLQPRYYLVVAVPLTMILVRVAEHLLRGRNAVVLSVAGVAFLVLAGVDARQTMKYVRQPEYTFARAAEKVEALVNAEKSHSRLVLSISGSDLSLMTGLPSICDDFGTMDLDERIEAYQPGWFVAWNYVEDDKMEALAKFYRLTRVAAFPAMDDPDRNLLIVYRLDSKTPEKQNGRERKKLLPTRSLDNDARPSVKDEL